MRLTVTLLAMAGARAAEETTRTVVSGPSKCRDAEQVKPGRQIAMHYEGMIDITSRTGVAFDKVEGTRASGAPFVFIVGAGKVIKGWDTGLVGLCKGNRVTLVVPPSLGFGDKGKGKIPAGATVNCDIEIVDVREPPPDVLAAEGTDKQKEAQKKKDNMPKRMLVFDSMDLDDDGQLSKLELMVFFLKAQSPGALRDGDDAPWIGKARRWAGEVNMMRFNRCLKVHLFCLRPPASRLAAPVHRVCVPSPGDRRFLER